MPDEDAAPERPDQRRIPLRSSGFTARGQPAPWSRRDRDAASGGRSEGGAGGVQGVECRRSGGVRSRTGPMTQPGVRARRDDGRRSTTAATSLAAAAVRIHGGRRLARQILPLFRSVRPVLSVVIPVHGGVGIGDRGRDRHSVQDDGQRHQGAKQLPGGRICLACHRDTLLPQARNRKARQRWNDQDWKRRSPMPERSGSGPDRAIQGQSS